MLRQCITQDKPNLIFQFWAQNSHCEINPLVNGLAHPNLFLFSSLKNQLTRPFSFPFSNCNVQTKKSNFAMHLLISFHLLLCFDFPFCPFLHFRGSFFTFNNVKKICTPLLTHSMCRTVDGNLGFLVVRLCRTIDTLFTGNCLFCMYTCGILRK